MRRPSLPVVVGAVAIVCVVLAAAAPPLIGSALLGSGEPQGADRARAEARVRTEVEAYAAAVAGDGAGPAGPSDARLLALRAGHDVRDIGVVRRAPTLALVVHGAGQFPSVFGNNGVSICYRVDFHDLGTPAAGATLTALPACTTETPFLVEVSPPVTATPTPT